jgi:hypothetical protein
VDTSPIEAYLRWLTDAPAEVQWFVAIQIIATAPEGLFNARSPEVARNPFAALESRLVRGERTPAAVVSMSVLLRFLTERVMQSRAAPEHWQRARRNTEEATVAVERDRGPGSLPPTEELTRDFGARSRTWVAQYEPWSRLRDSRLTDEALAEWEQMAIADDRPEE